MMKLRDWGDFVNDGVEQSKMKIQVLSDLHIEVCPFAVEKAGDVLVLAGDIFSGRSIDRWEDFIVRTMGLGFKAVIFVMGNHEGYGWSYEGAKQTLRYTENKYDGFHFLDRSTVTIDGVRFIGCPLWSNPSDEAIVQARMCINDYRAVTNWTIDDHIEEGERDREYLFNNIREGDVVVTHFPPTKIGIDQERFGGDVLNDWFANNLENLVRLTGAGLWISGHTHHTWLGKEGRTLLVGNCRGYSRIHHSTGQEVREVKNFDPLKTINYRVYNGADESSGGVAD